MSEQSFTHTSTGLLAGLHDLGNYQAWSEFDQRYRPILLGFLRSAGLSDADAADVAQETIACFVRDYREHKYDRAQGRLRSWLIGIARCRLVDLRRAAVRRREMRGESALGHLSDDVDAEALWDAEQRRQMFAQAIEELRQTSRFNERTIEAFNRSLLGDEPIEAVASSLGLSPQEIYNAKSRIVGRLREIIARYETCLPAPD